MRGAEVTVVRTESHLSRFNTARALFEKIAEENRGFHRIEKSPSAAASFAGTRHAGNVLVAPQRSRSSSAGSMSPPRSQPLPAVPPAVHNGDRAINGSDQPPPKPAKPSILPKPEKPDRRYTKELIEKQRNWTSHFNKPRPPKPDFDVIVESKYPSGLSEKQLSEKSDIPSRVYSPPLSPCAGDTIERPTTLPGSLVSRVSLPKTTSPSKSASPVSPSPRSINLVSSSLCKVADVRVPKPDIINSPVKTIQQENQPTEKVYSAVRCSVLETKEAIPDTKETYIQLDNLRSADTPTQTDDIPKSEHATSTRTSSSNIITPPKHSVEKYDNDEPSVPIAIREAAYKPECSPVSPTQIPESEIRRSSSTSKSPSPESNIYEAVDTYMKTSPDRRLESDEGSRSTENDDGYEIVEYRGDGWGVSGKRRSSTPESPDAPAPIDQPVQSSLASPMVSPVHRPSASPTAVEAQLSPGKLHFACIMSTFIILSSLCVHFSEYLAIIIVKVL